MGEDFDDLIATHRTLEQQLLSLHQQADGPIADAIAKYRAALPPRLDTAMIPIYSPRLVAQLRAYLDDLCRQHETAFSDFALQVDDRNA